MRFLDLELDTAFRRARAHAHGVAPEDEAERAALDDMLAAAERLVKHYRERDLRGRERDEVLG